CMALDSVTISEPTALTATHTQADVSCNGGADGSATFVVTGGGVPPYSYNWQPVAGTDTTLANLAAGAYTATATDNSGCTISHVFTIAQPTYQLWTGAADSFWSNPANWQCGTLPDINTDVFIPLSAVQMPVIDITTAQANNVFINSGAALRFTGTGNRLEVQGDITNLGTFVSLNGTLRLSGSSYQSIPGGTYAGIELAGAGVKQSLTSLLLTSHLQANGGYLQLNNNNITLAPGATAAGGSAASFVYLNGSGRMTVQGVGMGGTTGQVLFPVGNQPGVYTPAAIQNGGTADNFTVNVIDGIYPDYNGETPVGAPLWGFSVAKTWFITEAVNGGSDATVWLSWPLSEELPGFNNSLCDVSHYNTTTGNWEAGTIGQATGTTALFTHSRQNVTSFSPFGLGTDSQPLAQCDVHLVAAYNPGSEAVVLNWNATCDRNVERYVAERSADGIRFTEAGTKPAGAEQYSFSDAEAIRQPEKNLYYRLRLHRNNGDVLHTNIAKVTLPGNVVTGSGLVVYPNPVAGNVAYISIADNRLATDADVVLTDITGREALRQHFAAGSYAPRRMELSTAALPAGVYHLVLKQAGAVQRAATFTKE
ncbi:MAG: hypothetical protein JNL72_07825, partial [Flavipsychrobacter sp.]|nr:hypothetical protein [Flavipsychrobacter sp.]